MRALLTIGFAMVLASAAAAAPANTPHNSWVASPHGVKVHVEASSDSKVVAVLWSGARVFVRETSGGFARIDGYGVAGYAFVDRGYIGDQPPAPAPASTASTPAHR